MAYPEEVLSHLSPLQLQCQEGLMGWDFDECAFSASTSYLKLLAES